MKMKALQDSQNTEEKQSSSQASHESPVDQQNNVSNDAPIADSGSVSSSESKKVSREDIELVQNLIERCLQLYMNRAEVVNTLLTRARIEPEFTNLVWQKLEEENSDFFRAYYIRLKLKKQIILFNNLLEHQYHLMKYPAQPKVPLAPIQNGIHPVPVNNVPIGYPVIQQSPIPATGQPHLDPMGCGGLSNCHLVNGIPALGNFHPMRMNSGNDAMSSVSEMATSPASVASNSHFPFSSEMQGIDADQSAPDNTFASDVARLHLGSDSVSQPVKYSFASSDQIPWNFSFSDLTTDLDGLGPLENYTGSAFLPSESDILLHSSEQDDIVKEFFADSVSGACSQSDEENHEEQESASAPNKEEA